MWGLSVAYYWTPKHSISNVQCLCREGRNAVPLWMTMGVKLIVCIIFLLEPRVSTTSATF